MTEDSQNFLLDICDKPLVFHETNKQFLTLLHAYGCPVHEKQKKNLHISKVQFCNLENATLTLM